MPDDQREILKNKTAKAILFFTGLAFLFLRSGFWYDREKALALEELGPVIVCEKGQMAKPSCQPLEIGCPKNTVACPAEACGVCYEATSVCCCPESANELEIPLGRAIDQVQYLNSKTIGYGSDLALPLQQIILASQEMIESASSCPFEGLKERSDQVERASRVLEQSFKLSQKELEGFEGPGGVAEKLRLARTRLADCTVAPIDIEGLERGEKLGKILLNCQEVLESKIPIHALLGQKIQEGCYGNLYCSLKKEKGEELPWPPGPCAEDYFCCQ